MSEASTGLHSRTAPTSPVTKTSRTGLWISLVIIAAILIGGGIWLANRSSAGSEGATSQPSGRQGDRVMPVVGHQVKKGDIPIYLDALGTVTSFNTVTIRSRVDGEVLNVAYTEGQIVKKGDLLVEIDPRVYQAQLGQAQGQLLKDEALLKSAKSDLARYEDAKETVPQQTIDTAKATVAQYEGSIKVDKAVIDNANLQIEFCKITAPIDGKIGLRLVDVGNLVRANDTAGLAVITQMDPIAVVFNLPEVNLPSVIEASAGGKELQVEIYNADRGRLLAKGALKAIDNQIDSTTATVRIKAAFENKSGLLFPNQFVNVRLLLKNMNDVVLAPANAIQRSPESMFVYVVDKEQKVEMRKVTPGPSEGGMTVITDGLQPGETVVTQGLDKLAPGMKVAVRDRIASTQPTTRGAGEGREGRSGKRSQ